MAGYEWAEDLMGKDFIEANGRQPFNDVYFTGMVRDAQRRKMSKSLGNSPDALNLIDKYGADGVRFGMLSSGSAGNDIIFDAPIDGKTKKALDESKLCAQGSAFCNKMWNAMRMLKLLEKVEKPTSASAEKINPLVQSWMDNKLNQLLEVLEGNYKNYKLGDAMMNLYNFIWNDFFSEYLEMIKPTYGEPIDNATYETAIGFFEKLMTVLHPFMPFITEELWHQLGERKEGEDCVISTYPTVGSFDKKAFTEVDTAIDIISKIRATRKDKGMKDKEPLKLFIQKSATTDQIFSVAGIKEIIEKRGFISEIHFTDSEDVDGTIAFVSGTDKFFLEANIQIDVEAEKEKITKDLEYTRGFVKSIEKKLSNERFVQNAPEAVVNNERKKLADGQARIKILEESLAQLG